MKQDLFDKLLRMEVSFDLFDLKEDGFIPVWDFIRVELFNNGIQKKNAVSLKKEKRKGYAKFFFYKLLKGLFYPRNVDYVFVYCPRFLNKSGECFDRIADDLIEYTSDYNCVYVNSGGLFSKSKQKSHSLFIFNVLSRFACFKKNMSKSNYEVIHNAVLNTFGLEVSYHLINGYYRNKLKNYYAYYYFLKWACPRKIFVSLDLQKGCFLAARMLNIPSCEIQHGTLVYHYSSYSYPDSINYDSNIAFADFFASPGEGWGINTNVPCKERVILGNSSFVLNIKNNYDDGSILVISNTDHCKYLIPLSVRLAELCNNRIIYKLHPSEYSYLDYYKKEFEDRPSIEVAPISASLSDYIASCSVLITISSTAFFEAKAIGKRVAILKIDNYFTLEPYIGLSNDTFLVDKAEDIIDVLSYHSEHKIIKYYMPFDTKVADYLIS